MAKTQTKRRATSARELLHRRFYKDNPRGQDELAQTWHEMALGHKIRRLREEAGLTQQELAERMGTHAPAISRLEDADYDRHSKQMLEKVAQALDMRLIIDFQPKTTNRAKGM